jgi:hypothetical protein
LPRSGALRSQRRCRVLFVQLFTYRLYFVRSGKALVCEKTRRSNLIVVFYGTRITRMRATAPARMVQAGI